MRLVAAFLTIAAVAGLMWVFSLPDKAECAASGRLVDPTGRHCLSPGGYQQLQEHALFHTSEVVVGVAVLLAGGLLVRHYLRRPRAKSAPGSGSGRDFSSS